MRLPSTSLVLLLCCGVLVFFASSGGDVSRSSKLESSMSLLQKRAAFRTARLEQLASVIPGLVRCSGFVSCPLGFKIPKSYQLTGQFEGDSLTIVDNPDDSFLNVHGMNSPSNDVGYPTSPVGDLVRLAAKHELQADAFNSHLRSQIEGKEPSRVRLDSSSSAAASDSSSEADPESGSDKAVAEFNEFAESVLDSDEAAASAEKELNEEGWEDEPIVAPARHAPAAHEQLQSQAQERPYEEGYLERQRRLFTRGLSQSMLRMLKRKGPRR
jgi:hypothetical protein